MRVILKFIFSSHLISLCSNFLTIKYESVGAGQWLTINHATLLNFESK